MSGSTVKSLGAGVALTLASVLLASACGGSDVGKEEEPIEEATIERVLEQHTPRLLALGGVVGTGIGDCAGTRCIKVFVDELTPSLKEQIPARLDGYQVEVEETGPVRALDPE